MQMQPTVPVHAFWEQANKKARDRFTTLSKVYEKRPRYSHVISGIHGDHLYYVSFLQYDGYPHINLFQDGVVSFSSNRDDFKFMLLRTWLDLEPV